MIVLVVWKLVTFCKIIYFLKIIFFLLGEKKCQQYSIVAMQIFHITHTPYNVEVKFVM